MTGLPFTGSNLTGKIYAFIGIISRKPFYPRLLLLLLVSALADIGLAALGLNPMSRTEQRLLFIALSLYVLIFAAAFQMIAAGEIASRTTSLIAFIECHRRPVTSLLIGIGFAGGL